MTKYVVYRRLSKESKTRGNLGLEAQQASIDSYLSRQPNYQIVANLTEIESGTRKGNDRPVLKEALQLCKNTDAVLLIATLSRLSRNVHFISGLMESGVEFAAIDMPVFNKTMLYVAAAFAEQEADYISQRTKAAVAEARKQGKKPGNPQHLHLPQAEEGRRRYHARRRTLAVKFAEQVYPSIAYYKGLGYSNFRVAEELNTLGIVSPAGTSTSWTLKSVAKCINRVKGVAI